MKTLNRNTASHVLVILCCVGLQQAAQAGQFAPAVNYPTGINPFGVAVGDFNRDGIPDLVVANAGGGAGTVSILLGNGDGTFRASREFDAGGSETTTVAVGDFNGDGKPDLVVANYGGGGGSFNVAVLLGNGDGTFMPPVAYTAGISPDFVAVADFNGDGNLDFVAGSNAGGPAVGNTGVVSVFLGKGDGTFAPAVNYPTGIVAAAITVADLNGDGRLDLAVSNENSDNISVLLGRGDGTFQASVDYPAGPGPRGIASGDFNGDGRLDLVVANAGGSFGTTVSVLIGNGDGTFQAPVSYPAGNEPFAVAVGDFNMDGKLDLIVADSGVSFGTTVSLLLGNGDGTFQTAVPYTVGVGAVSVAVADLNSDGLLDVAVANITSNNVSVLLNAGQACRVPPDIVDIRARPHTLRPSGRLVDVFVGYHATSNCGEPPVCSLSVGSNEPLTAKDYWIIDAHHVELRADVSDREKRERSDGRIYAIQVSCTDARGNVARGDTVVTVSEDHRRHRDRDSEAEKEDDVGSSD